MKEEGRSKGAERREKEEGVSNYEKKEERRNSHECNTTGTHRTPLPTNHRTTHTHTHTVGLSFLPPHCRRLGGSGGRRPCSLPRWGRGRNHRRGHARRRRGHHTQRCAPEKGQGREMVCKRERERERERLVYTPHVDYTTKSHTTLHSKRTEGRHTRQRHTRRCAPRRCCRRGV